MMYNFPFYPHFPTKSYRGYPQSIHSTHIKKQHNSSKFNNANSFNNKKSTNANNFCYEQVDNNSVMESTLAKNPDLCFEILGIKLYSDDVLLLCLIFFLYKEGVQDEYLFIALIMLLLS